MTSKEIIQRIIGALEDDLQHYTMVDKDNVKAKLIKFELEEYNTILKDLELFEKCKNENSDYQIKNAELQEENEKLKQVLDILKKYLYLFSDQSIPEIAWVEDYYLSLTGNDWCIEITQEEYEPLKEVLGNENN